MVNFYSLWEENQNGISRDILTVSPLQDDIMLAFFHQPTVYVTSIDPTKFLIKTYDIVIVMNFQAHSLLNSL